MFFTFPEDARWNAERQALEFGVEIGEYQGVVRVPRRVFQRLLPERPTPERCVQAYYLQRTRFERVAERKLRRRLLTEDGNVEITGRDLRPPRRPRARERGDDDRRLAAARAAERFTPRFRVGDQPAATSSGCAHRLVVGRDLACRGEYVSRLGCGEGLGRDRAFYPAAPRCDERQHACGLGIRNF
jgi:hypothetical protein